MNQSCEISPTVPVVWRPQPRQAEFMRRPEPEALYGGAAGGGKSDALVIEALRQVDIPHYRGLILRKTYPQLSDLVDKSMNYYRRAFPGAQYNATAHVWVFPSGAKIYFGSMQYTKDRTNYQGKAFDFIGFDELTHFEWEEYSYMMSRNRPTGPGTRVYMRATTNPGGAGHGWVKERFITPAPPGTPIREEYTVHMPDGTDRVYTRARVFIPSSVFDNPALLENDPDYLASLAALPEAPTETENLSTLCASDKEALLDKMPEGEIKTQLSAWMEMGLCLHNAEGTYFFVVDYPEYLAEYGQTVDGATADFLTLAADEVKAPTLVEEYLSVDVETLGQRALAYETFLSQYPDFALADKVRIYWNGALSKLVYPTLYDQLVDESGQASADLMALYQELAGQTACPVLQSTAQSMLDFIVAQPDQSLADSDQVSQNASALAEEARQMADELYGPLPQ